MFYKDDRLTVMIDGVSFFYTCRSIGLQADYRKLHAEFARRGRLRKIAYYTPVGEGGDYNPIQPTLDWMAYNGFQVIRKGARPPEGIGRPRATSTDAEFAVDIVLNARNCDHLVLMTGSRDMVYPVQVAQRSGCRVTVFSSIRGETPTIADELRRTADAFVDLESLRDLFARDPAPADLADSTA